jgi:hypothetical protein
MASCRGNSERERRHGIALGRSGWSTLPSVRAVLRRRFRASLGPTPFQVSPVKLPVSNRENLSPAAGRADEVNLRSSSCWSVRPGDLRLGQSGRWLPSLDISLGYTCGIGITAGLLAVHIRHRLR